VAVPSGCEVGEHPVWDSISATLVWVDVTAGTVHRSTPPRDTPPGSPWTDEDFRVGDVVGAAALRRDGGLVVATDSHVVLLDRNGRPDGDPIPVDMPAGARFNDIACDPRGSLLAGTTTGSSAAPDGLLWSLSPSGALTKLLDGVVESNGLGWSLDGATLYYVDSGEPAIRRYRYDPAESALGDRLTDLAVIDAGHGVPDGLVVDADGTVWVALWNGAALHRYSSDGELLVHIDVPVSRPTCPAFMGTDLNRLVLTTGWEGMTDSERATQPWAGHLLTTAVDARGRHPHRYAGGPR
jgi:sugar lactone lactonase YvrE